MQAQEMLHAAWGGCGGVGEAAELNPLNSNKVTFIFSLFLYKTKRKEKRMFLLKVNKKVNIVEQNI